MVYGHDENLNKSGVIVYNTLRLVNFPAECRYIKAMEDYKNFSLLDHKEETSKKRSELKPLMEQLYTDLREKKETPDVWTNFYLNIKRLQEKWKEQKRISKYHVEDSYDNNTKPLGPYKEAKDQLKTIVIS